MIVYRLSKERFCRDLSGRGAERSGGRWNSKGTPMLYTSQSRALCTTEIAVHSPLGIIPKDYFLTSIEIPDRAAKLVISQKMLPPDWNTLPHSDSTQKIGDAFVKEGKYLVMKAPSVVVKGDFNFLINPLHKDFGKIKIIEAEAFDFDERLFVR